MRASAFALCVSCFAVASTRTHAQDYAGSWQAGPLSIRHEIESWGGDCGPRPPATMSEPGGAVTIAQNGDHLRFSGALRGSTDACWSEKPGIRRISSTFRDPSWTTICRTRDGDAQPENGRYTFRAAGDTITFQEVTQWNWRLRSSTCTATRRASRTFTRVGAATTEPEEPEEPEPQCTAGAAARVRISPARETIEPGQQICVRARVVDAQGCPLRDARVQLELRAPEGQRGTLRGRCFTAGATAAEAEGVFRIVGTAGSLRGSAEIEVTTEDLSDLTARRIRESSMGEALSDAEAENASGLEARVMGRSGTIWIVGGVLALLLILGGAVLLVARRRKPEPEKKPDLPDPDPAPVAATAKPPRRVCPVCGYEEEGGDGYCPKDGAQLVDPNDPTTRAQGMICPTCRRGYGADATKCSQDGDELVPYSMFIAREKRASVEVKKICPKCGTSYDAQTTFCGKDGSPLEIVN